MISNLDAVRDVYKKFSEGDLDGFLGLCDENIEWVVNGPASLEKCQTFHGRNGARSFLDILGSTWKFHSFDARNFIVENNTVVVLGDEAGIDIESEVFFENRWVHVFDIHDGKIVRFRGFLCHWPGKEKPPVMTWDDVES